jgi:ubiquinone/menaquinone biosynthesis C-methylase UbiE
MPVINIPYKTIIAHYKSVLPTYSTCKLLEYKHIKDDRTKKPYHDVASKKQIQTILKISHTKSGFDQYHRLLQLLLKHIKIDDYILLLKIIFERKSLDDEIYTVLQNYLIGGKNEKKSGKKSVGKSVGKSGKKVGKRVGKIKGGSSNKSGITTDCTRNSIHGQMYNYIIRKHVLSDKNFKLENYLDIGCGDCEKTKIIGNYIGLPDSKIYGVDITKWGGYTQEKRLKVPINITLIDENDILPFANNSFSLVSAYMVLHHVRNLGKLLHEINRVLYVGGYFVIREHDAMNNVDYMLCDIEHAMYDVVHRNDMNFFTTYYAKYYDWLEWDIILAQFGFQYIHADYDSTSIHSEISATRYFHGVYKKIKDLQ